MGWLWFAIVCIGIVAGGLGLATLGTEYFWPVWLFLFIRNKGSKWESKPLYSCEHFDANVGEWIQCHKYGKAYADVSPQKVIEKAKKGSPKAHQPYTEFRSQLHREGILKSDVKRQKLEKLSKEKSIYREKYIKYLEKEMEKFK